MNLSGKQILVTGATGFLGGAIARRLASDGVHVRALVRNPQRAGYIRDIPNIELVSGSLAQPERLREAVSGCEVIIHSAATLKGTLTDQLAANRDGTRHLATTAAEAGVQRFVHISTISVYGYRNTQDVTEATPPNPGRDPYGISKLAAEVALEQVADQLGLSYSIIRPGMIYGPRSGMWTGQMFNVARRNPTIFIGDGSGSCYPIHVDDVVDLTMLLTTHPNAVGKTFNCTPDPSPTWREFLGAYSRLAHHQRWLGVPPVLLRPVAALAGVFAPEDSPLRDLPDLLPFSQRYITYKTTKARELFDWQPKVSLQAGIAGCADWLRERRFLA